MNYTITTPKFTGRNVPLMEIAQATGKSAQFQGRASAWHT